MAEICVTNTGLAGLVIIEPTIFGDDRGYFLEAYNTNEFKKHGLPTKFVQDNESMSKKGVLRGLHFQTNNPQGKLVRVVTGEVYDVAVDLRGNSVTYGKWAAVVLSGTNKKMFYIPPGFAHGFLVLSDEAVFTYKCTTPYDPYSDSGILYNDNDLGIEWPISEGENLLLSEKDKCLKSFSNFKTNF
ncbi:dTDP-4-dehydrorhamnose 3,5-epimerase [Fusibacter paucivorans]|uniref:dTDP-4-dehydrorhamnose 3,5-epimerase n=1 Tax=Fusibacter paucivorans TaxID=76009 RepID=A0ABS5PNH8_9FIRM|nr:dTDP-4-dehydrorhamnose 3,5-epimerase [Fusibacter paucivorans]MBS7526601.1 dTDP-4-dehydrorhamnose 3,5-epimerase [Fusibacter paucivorans]